MKKSALFMLLGLLAAAGCSAEDKSNETEPRQQESEEAASAVPEAEEFAADLKTPWSIDKAGSTFYMTERTGSIVKAEEGSLERQEVRLKKKLSQASEAGLLGFVLSPDFESSGEAFAYYTYEEGSVQQNRIVVLKQTDDAWEETRLLLDGIPSGQYHHGGRLKIGPDGKLYATAGDAAADPEIAQDLDSLGGKILRMNLDGTVPGDNPFAGSYVYSYGHRNPQGLAWAEDGTLYASEHGPSANDEINRIEAGKNYGWPVIQGKQEKEGMETPLFTSGEDNTWAPSGIAIKDGKLYAAALRGTAVLEFNLESGEQKELITGAGRVRDVLLSDNVLYFASNNTDGRGNPGPNDDKLYKIRLSE
ncbi:PQQ-dependent sugar dehydrogenase [Bacillus infantis]|uniref:PQQ-dependent sugar dehydrogenase n=1 Tax=Bacillus infantis TaxID=324767 RepID=UPI003CEFD516